MVQDRLREAGVESTRAELVASAQECAECGDSEEEEAEEQQSPIARDCLKGRCQRAKVQRYQL